MAKDQALSLKATTGYLKGKVEDTETIVNEQLNNDIVQFFVKLMNLASLSPNGNYDNETNGYQFIDALVAKIVATINIYTTGFKFKEVEIGDWNMNATAQLSVAHGLSSSEWKTARIISVVIRNDSDNLYHVIERGLASNDGEFQCWVSGFNVTNVDLVRRDSGVFDSATFETISYNRGWIVLIYK